MVVSDIEIFLKKEKIKSANRLMKDIENFQKMKKGQLSIEKIVLKYKKIKTFDHCIKDILKTYFC